MKNILLAIALVAFSTVVMAGGNHGQNPGLGINGTLDLSGYIGQGAISQSAVSGGIVSFGPTNSHVSSWAKNYSVADVWSFGCGECGPDQVNKTFSISKGGAHVHLSGNAIEGAALYSANGSAVSGYALTGALSVYGEYGVIDAAYTGVNFEPLD